MAYIGKKPTDKPLTSADLGTGIVTSTAILDGTIANTDVNSSAAIALSKLSTTGSASSSNYLRGDGAWSTVEGSTLATEGATFANYNTITATVASVLASGKNHFLCGTVTVNAPYVWTITGEPLTFL